MDGIVDIEFLKALLRSQSFMTQMALYLGLCIVLTGVAVLLLHRLWKLRERGTVRIFPAKVHEDDRGGSAILDFVLVTPIFMTVVFLILQFAAIANATLVVHHAAYVAARAARVHAWVYPDDTPFGVAGAITDHTPVPNYAGIPFATPQEAAERAARLALIAASPAAQRIPKRRGEMEIPTAIYQAVARTEPEFRGHDRRSARERVYLERARFAFDPRNVSVEITYPTMIGGFLSEAVGRPLECPSVTCIESPVLLPVVHNPGTPVSATVRFKVRLVFPIAARLWCALPDACSRNGNHFFRVAKAKVTLL